MEQKQAKRRGRPPKSEQKPKEEKQVQFEITEEPNSTIIIDSEEEGFLENLNNENYGKEMSSFEMEQDQEEIEEAWESETEQQHYDPDAERLLNVVVDKFNEKRGRKKKNQDTYTQTEDVFTPDLFSSKGSQILGRTKRELVAKLTQYRQLFPEELKQFKVKKDANEEELQAYLDEMEVIVSVSSVDNFITDSILNCIRIVEGVSANTSKYNISGCADLLKQNREFHSLCKQLYIKYKVFSSVPCEYQLVMIVATTAFIARSKNIHMEKMTAFLNEQVPLGNLNNKQ